jgi:hypothetical protein
MTFLFYMSCHSNRPRIDMCKKILFVYIFLGSYMVLRHKDRLDHIVTLSILHRNDKLDDFWIYHIFHFHDMSCRCNAGWKGAKCEQPDPCSSNPCKNNGTCSQNKLTFNCHCSTGWTGNQCETEICYSNTCHGHGRCSTIHNTDLSVHIVFPSILYYTYKKQYCSMICRYHASYRCGYDNQFLLNNYFLTNL